MRGERKKRNGREGGKEKEVERKESVNKHVPSLLCFIRVED